MMRLQQLQARKRMLPLLNPKRTSQPKEVGARKIPKQKSSLLKPNRKQNLCRKLKKRNPSEKGPRIQADQSLKNYV